MWVSRNLKVETDSTRPPFIMRGEVDLSVPPEVHYKFFGFKDVQLQVILWIPGSGNLKVVQFGVEHPHGALPVLQIAQRCVKGDGILRGVEGGGGQSVMCETLPTRSTR